MRARNDLERVVRTLTSEFKVGDRVRIKEDLSSSNPRYKLVRGWIGLIAVFHGRINNPMERGGFSSPMYTVVFERPDNVKIWFDTYEDWMEPV